MCVISLVCFIAYGANVGRLAYEVQFFFSWKQWVPAFASPLDSPDSCCARTAAAMRSLLPSCKSGRRETWEQWYVAAENALGWLHRQDWAVMLREAVRRGGEKGWEPVFTKMVRDGCSQGYDPTERARRLLEHVGADGKKEIPISKLNETLQRNENMRKDLGWPDGQLSTLWALMDRSGTGCVSPDALRYYCQVRWLFDLITVTRPDRFTEWELEIALARRRKLRADLGISADDASRAFGRMDSSETGYVTLDRFYRYCIDGNRAAAVGDWRELADRLTPSAAGMSDSVVAAIAVTLDEVAAALRSDQAAQLELGCAPQRVSEFFADVEGAADGTVTVADLRGFVRLRWLFDKIDKGRTGFIDPFDFGNALADPQIAAELRCPLANAQELFCMIDVDQSQYINFTEFFRYFSVTPAHKFATASPDAAAPATAPRARDPSVGVRTDASSDGRSAANRYEVLKKLGGGTFGEVFLCRRRMDGLQLVLKRPIAQSWRVVDGRGEAGGRPAAAAEAPPHSAARRRLLAGRRADHCH
eukprot:TRINITY_DN9920_c0_g2_i5.p1 TRINITY_DN9920_c0_g2~~TRINITY_DN9920_c0_g2_i5.p1  ORF type:complete len:532 (+),score=129.74 TRINITY_DN9920_c0_g2_i5:1571-3166(+)